MISKRINLSSKNGGKKVEKLVNGKKGGNFVDFFFKILPSR